MISFKMDPHTLYTDTDSIFSTKKLDLSLIGKELGLMKDELDGKVIEEILILGCKQYGSPSSTPSQHPARQQARRHGGGGGVC